MTRRASLSRGLRIAFLLVAVALLVFGVVQQWDAVSAGLSDIGLGHAALALVGVLAGLFFSALSWRALLDDLGAHVGVAAALRIFFVGQLGKYLPGSVWPVLAQMELGRDHGLSRRRVGAGALVIMGLNITTGLLVAAVLLPFTSREAFHHYAWVLLVLPLGLAFLHPRVLTPVVNGGLRLARRPPLEAPLTLRGVGAAVGWALAMWAGYGVQIWVLASALQAHGARLPLVATGAFALAWTVGFLLVLAPAGLGPRELALVLALAPVLAHGPATAVALVSRVLMTLGDLVWGALGLAARRQPAAPAADVPR